MNRNYNSYDKQEKTCGIFIFDKKLNLLLCHPTNAPKDFWSIPKGLANDGEKFLTAAIREVEEETGIDYGNYKEEYFINLTYQKYQKINKILIPFVIFGEEKYSNLECHSMVNPNTKEIDDFDWVPYEDAFDVMHDTQCYALEEIENKYILNKSWLNIYNNINKNKYGQVFSINNF